MSDARRLDPVPAAGGEGPLERAALALRQGRALDVALQRRAESSLAGALERARRSLLGARRVLQPALLSLGGSPAQRRSCTRTVD